MLCYDDMSHTVEGALVDASLIVELGINYRYGSGSHFIAWRFGH